MSERPPRRPLLGGRFAAPPSDEMARFSSSLAVDLKMLDEDVDGSIAHAVMLGEAGILDPGEAAEICAGLERVRSEIRRAPRVRRRRARSRMKPVASDWS